MAIPDESVRVILFSSTKSQRRLAVTTVKKPMRSTTIIATNHFLSAWMDRDRNEKRDDVILVGLIHLCTKYRVDVELGTLNQFLRYTTSRTSFERHQKLYFWKGRYTNIDTTTNATSTTNILPHFFKCEGCDSYAVRNERSFVVICVNLRQKTVFCGNIRN